MGVPDSYRDTFTSWAGTTRETKGEGSDLATAKARFISITLRGGSGHVCTDARQLKESTQEGSEEIGVASVPDFLATVAMPMLTNLTHFNWREDGSFF